MGFSYLLFLLSLRFWAASSFRYNRPYQVISLSVHNAKHQFYSPSKTSQAHSRPSMLNAALVATPSLVTKKSLADLGPHELSGKRVLLRCDLNVPLDGTTITDDTRIRASIKTIQYLVGSGAKVILATHLGRPKGVADPKYSVSIIKGRIEELLNKPILMCDDCIGDAVRARVNTMLFGDVLLLENVRFHREETANDESFARSLAANADLYVNDAFGVAHRAHASTEGVARILKPSVAGFLMKKELDFLSHAVARAQRPFAAIVGGSKISSKIGVMEALLDRVDKLIIGGAMVFTFLKARGLSVGSSLIEDDKITVAQRLESMAKEKGVEFILPTDVVVGNKFAADADDKVVPVESIPSGWWGLDNGPKSTGLIISKIQDCKTILWNGPMGKFEFDKFSKGTNELAKAMAAMTAKGTVTIVGGGDSVAAIEKSGLANKISHISTGGGASLEFLEGRPLPGVTVLNDL